MWGKRFGPPLLTIQGLVPGPLPSEKSLSFCSTGSLPQLDAGVGALFLLWLQQTSSWQRDHCRKERKRPGPPGFIFLKMMLPHLSTYVPSGTVHSRQERGATPVSIDNQWMNGMWSIHMVRMVFSLKREGILPPATRWMSILLSEASGHKRTNTELDRAVKFVETEVGPGASERDEGLLFEGCAAAAAAKSLQSCLTLCSPIDSSPPGFHVPGILQARALQWVAISFSNT